MSAAEDPTNRVARGESAAWIPLAISIVLAGATLALAGYDALDLPGYRDAGRIAVTTALAGLCAIVVTRLRRTAPAGGERRPAASVVHLALTVAVALYAGLALPEDLHLFTLGRPPQLLIPLALALGCIAIDGALALARGASLGTASAPLLVAALTLEGLPLATPPWLMLALSGIIVVGDDAVGHRVHRGLGFALIALVTSFALAGALGADPGSSLDPTLRIAGLALAAFTIARSGQGAARRALGALFATLLGASLLAFATKALLAAATAEFDVAVFGSELSLFGRHPNAIASWFGAGAVAALLAARTSRSTPLRSLARIAFPCALVALLLTASRLALAATFATMLLAVALRYRSGRRTLALGASLVAIAGVLGIGALSLPPLRAKLVSSLTASDAIDHRGFRMRVGIAAAAESPLLGHGPLCWFAQGAVTPRSRFEGETSSDHPHSLPIALAASTGTVGLLAFLAFLAALGGLARAGSRDPDADVARLAAGVALASCAQLATNLMDMGDALATIVPSRLFFDAAILAALVADTAPRRSLAGITLRVAVGSGAAILALICGLARAERSQGREAARQGDEVAALDAAERAIALLPFDTDAHLEAARAAFGANKRARAREALYTALRLAPDRPDLHEAIAGVHRKLDDSAAALLSARRAIALDPFGDTPGRLGVLVAELELDAGDDPAALATLAKTVRIAADALNPFVDPTASATLRIGRHTVPRAALDAALRAELPPDALPVQRARTELRVFELAVASRDLPAARAALDAYRSLVPDAPSTSKFEAQLNAAEGDLAAALSTADTGLTRIDEPAFRADRAQYLLELGREDEALAAFRDALPAGVDVYFYAYAYHHALSRLAAALARSTSETARLDRERVLATLAFFVADDLDRARVYRDLALARAVAGFDADACDAALRAALRATLRAPDSLAVREMARELGTRLGELHRTAADRDRLADEYEQLALIATRGPAAHEYRVALLVALGLDARAAAARRDLAAAMR